MLRCHKYRHTMEDVRIGITNMKDFLQNLPSCFRIGRDGKLHHEDDEAVVFAPNNSIFAGAYHGVLIVRNKEEFSVSKQRLLDLPIYMLVYLERRREGMNYTLVTNGDYVIMVNTGHPAIQSQLHGRLKDADTMMRNRKNFAIEIKFEELIKQWFASNFQCQWGTINALHCNFCFTNYGRQMKIFKTMSFCWLCCLPCCLVCAPIYCIHRSIMCEDSVLKIQSPVTDAKGVLMMAPSQSTKANQSTHAGSASNIVSSYYECHQMNGNVYQDTPSHPPPPYPGPTTNERQVTGHSQDRVVITFI